MRTEFFLSMIPPTKTHQEKQVTFKGGKPVFFEPAELKAVRSKLESSLAKYVPDQKYTTAIQLVTKWCYPWPDDKVRDYVARYKTTKPDTDNMVKMIKDVMTKLGFWTDDALVASEIIEKFWADIPGIYVRIEVL